MPNYLVCYDIGENSERTRLARMLKKHGKRMQKSVFMIDISDVALKKLQQGIPGMLEEEDSVIFFALCKNCAENSQVCSISIDSVEVL